MSADKERKYHERKSISTIESVLVCSRKSGCGRNAGGRRPEMYVCPYRRTCGMEEEMRCFTDKIFVPTKVVLNNQQAQYQEKGKEAQELHPGDVVNIPANVKHWHGAAKDCWFQHLAIEVPGEETRTEWCEPMTDEVYGKLNQMGRA